MEEALKPSRYLHSTGVQEMAEDLARIYGADVEKAGFAGRYHDIAKCFSDDEMNAYVRKYGLADMYIDNNPLAHSKVAACILKDRFGVTDEEVLDAIRSHTTGRAGMSLLEEIVYVADAIEDHRHYEGLEELQELLRFFLPVKTHKNVDNLNTEANFERMILPTFELRNNRIYMLSNHIIV